MKRGKPERYLALAGEISEYIRSGRLGGDKKLPSERQLAAMLGANHLTIRKALKTLESAGLIYKTPGKGSFVGKKPAAMKNCGIIGLLFPEEDVFFFRILAEIEKLISVSGYHPMLFISGGSPEKETAALAYLDKIGADGLIAAPGAACAAAYSRLSTPVVFFDSGIEGSGIPRVLADDTRGARAVVDYMLSIGRKRVAHIGSGTDEPGRKRLEGYVSALKARGVHVDESIIKLREYSRGWGFYAAREILESPSRPDAIFCGNDSIAAGALRCLREMRVKCPAEISVAGFGDTPLAEDLDLTSVSQPCDVIAAAAWKNLQTILRGGSPPAETVIETGLVLRKSAAPPG